jgi:hypothetical protein
MSARARYAFGWVDSREVFVLGQVHTGKMVLPAKLSVEKKWSCPYCRNLYTDQSSNCHSCGAPK